MMRDSGTVAAPSLVLSPSPSSGEGKKDARVGEAESFSWRRLIRQVGRFWAYVEKLSMDVRHYPT
jgi:hypothetical protein